MAFYNKLKSTLVGHPDHQKPVLSSSNAALLSTAFVALYVAPFYLFRKTRPSPTLNRDAPSVIRARIQTVSLTATVSTLTTFYLLYVTGEYSLAASLHHVGLYPIDVSSIVKSFALTAVLYLGPLYESVYVDRDLSPLSSLPNQVRASLASSQGYRNFVAGPLTEELLFRSTIVTVHLLAHVSATKVTFLTPLYFGIAHVHHFYEFQLTHPLTPLVPALLRSVFQFGYTTIFGWYASFVYLRTGNLYAVFFIHVFCNWMGLPRLWGKLQVHDEPPALSSVMVRGKEDVDLITRGRSNHALSLRYTIIYYVLLVGGAIGFSKLLFPLTDSSEALASFGEK